LPNTQNSGIINHMVKRIIIAIAVILLIFGSLFNISGVYAQSTTSTTPSSGVIGFTQCNFATSSQSSSISPCVQQILTFLFVIGIFLMAFRIAYIGINRFNPLDGNSEGEQVGLIRDIIIGLVLLGAPALILSAFNQNLLSLDFLNFTGFTGGPVKQSTTQSTTNLQNTSGGGTIISSGSGTVAPVAAVATANISGGKVTSVSLTNQGSGYTSPPTVKLTGGGGSGATAVANVLGGKVTSVSVTSSGSGYTSAPTVELTGGTSGGGAGSGSITTQTNGNPTVQGVTLPVFQATYEGYKYTGSDANSALSKVIGAAEACKSVFASSQYSPNDCQSLGVKGYDGTTFDDALAQIPGSTKSSFLAQSNVLGYINYNGFFNQSTSFTNLVDIKVSPAGIPSKTVTAYSFGSTGNSTTCIENYITVEASGFPTRTISTQDCGNQLADNSGITKFDQATTNVINNPRPIFFPINGFNKSIIPNTTTIPAGTQFDRKITYIN
jgi:hypothetical protein